MTQKIERRLRGLETKTGSGRETIVLIRSFVGDEPIRIAVTGEARVEGAQEWTRRSGESIETFRARAVDEVKRAVAWVARPVVCLREFNRQSETNHAPT